MYKNNDKFDKIARHSMSRNKPMIDKPKKRVGVLVSKNGCEYLLSELPKTGKELKRIVGKEKAKVWQCKPKYGRGACNQTWESSQVRRLTRK